METKARFLFYQNVQLTDKYNNLLWQDVVLKDGSILRFDDNGFLHGIIETGDGYVQFFVHGKLDGSPAVISQDLKHIENWENGKLKKIIDNGQEEVF